MVPLTKLFSQDFFFRIPEYQRPFLWDDEDFTNLIDDLETAKWDEPYFLGTLVLHRTGGNEYDVVDGQQRLTALCILFACLRDSLDASDDKSLSKELHDKIFQTAKRLDSIPARDRVQVKDQAVFNSMIGTPGGASKPLVALDSKDAIGQRYESCRSIFWDRIEAMRVEEREKFAIFVTQKCTLIYLATNSFDDAFRLFTVVNDRGKQLRRIDVLKAHNLDPGYIPTASARTTYANRWELLETRLGEREFEDIFGLLRLIYVKDKPQSDLYKEFADRILGKPGMPKAGPEFIDALERYVGLYDDLFIARDYLDGADGSKNAKYQTLMEAMVGYFSASEWKACALYSAEKFGKDDLYEFVLELEKVYLDHWVRGTRKDERYGVYTSILKKIETSKTADEVIAATKIDIATIRNACLASNFYGAGHSKYLLVRAEIVASELDHPRHFQARSVEHVLPQTPQSGSLWDTSFNDDERKELVDSAGNLVLLSKSKNSKASNREFESKKLTYLKDRVSDFPRSMEVLGYDSWTPDVIRERTKSFADAVLCNP